MPTFRYIVTVELGPDSTATAQDIQDEIDSNLESVILHFGIEHFTIERCDLLDTHEGQDYRERIIGSHEQ